MLIIILKIFISTGGRVWTEKYLQFVHIAKSIRKKKSVWWKGARVPSFVPR